MKKNIVISFLTILTGSCFAIEPSATAIDPTTSIHLGSEKKHPSLTVGATAIPVAAQVNNKGFFYVKMNVADTAISHPTHWDKKSYLPGVGFGYRKGSESAIDIAVGGSFKQGANHSETSFWSFPKMTYLRYASPKKNSSLYYGAGLIWGHIKQRFADSDKNRYFLGIIPVACLGYEFNHKEQSWRSFFEMEVSQPALAVAKKGSLPKPIAEFSVGLGY